VPYARRAGTPGRLPLLWCVERVGPYCVLIAALASPTGVLPCAVGVVAMTNTRLFAGSNGMLEFTAVIKVEKYICGAAQWVKGHWVAASALAFGATLPLVLSTLRSATATKGDGRRPHQGSSITFSREECDLSPPNPHSLNSKLSFSSQAAWLNVSTVEATNSADPLGAEAPSPQVT
jgi:hypothetical protein